MALVADLIYLSQLLGALIDNSDQGKNSVNVVEEKRRTKKQEESAYLVLAHRYIRCRARMVVVVTPY